MEDGYLSRIFTPLVLKSGLTCLGIQCTLHILFAFVLPKGPWTELPSFTAHQAVCLPLMIYVAYLGFASWFFLGSKVNPDDDTLLFQTFESRIFDISIGGSDLSHVIFGMLLFWDIPVGLCTPALHDTLMLIHHIAMLFVSGVVVGVFSNEAYPSGSYYAPFFFGVIEFSTIFLSLVDVFHPKHKAWYDFLQQESKKGTALGNALNTMNEICRVLFAISFLIFRTIYFPYVMFSTCLLDFYKAGMLPSYEQRHGTESWALFGVCLLALLFTFLQMYWGILVGKQVAKAIGILPPTSDSTTTTKAKKDEKKES